MGNYSIFRCSKIPGEACKQEILQQNNVPKNLDLKSSSEQLFFRKFTLGAPEEYRMRTDMN